MFESIKSAAALKAVHTHTTAKWTTVVSCFCGIQRSDCVVCQRWITLVWKSRDAEWGWVSKICLI